MKYLDPKDNDQLITIVGMVIMATAHFQCFISHNMADVDMGSKQMFKLQESPDNLQVGQIPHTVVWYVCGKLEDTVQPGDRFIVIGVYRAFPTTTNLQVVKGLL